MNRLPFLEPSLHLNSQYFASQDCIADFIVRAQADCGICHLRSCERRLAELAAMRAMPDNPRPLRIWKFDSDVYGHWLGTLACCGSISSCVRAFICGALRQMFHIRMLLMLQIAVSCARARDAAFAWTATAACADFKRACVFCPTHAAPKALRAPPVHSGRARQRQRR